MISRKLRGSLAEKNVIRERTLRKVKEVQTVLIAESIRKLFQGARQFRFPWFLPGLPQYSYNRNPCMAETKECSLLKRNLNLGPKPNQGSKLNSLPPVVDPLNGFCH